MSNDQSQSPPLRKVTPYKAGKRLSTVRKLDLDFAGTALEEALVRQATEEKVKKLESQSNTSVIPLDLQDKEALENTYERSNQRSEDQDIDKATRSLNNLVDKQPSRPDLVDKQPSCLTTRFNDSLTIAQEAPKPITDELAGYRTPNILDDEIMPTLTPSEQVILRRLFRLSYGFNRTNTDAVSYAKLAEKCHLGLTAVKDALKSLQMKNLIKIIDSNKYSPSGGNQYELTLSFLKPVDNLVVKQPGRLSTRSLNDPIIDDDLNNTNKDHHQAAHQRETMMIYQTITRNTWKSSDQEAYEKIKNLQIENIRTGIKLITQRATTKPNSLNYFVKGLLDLANPTPQSKSQRKKALEKIVTMVRERNIGGARLSIGEFANEVKDLCIHEDVAFDNDLFNEILKIK